MSAMPILDFAISLIFLALLMSLFVSWAIDYYASQLNKKGRHLQEMLVRLLGSDETINWSARLYRHPMIESLSIKSDRLTSYIPPKLFAEVITDLLVEEGRDYTFMQDKDSGEIEFKEEIDTKNLIDGIKKGLDAIPESDFKRSLKLFFEKSEGDAEAFSQHIIDWYNEYTQRIIHSYKRLLKAPMWVLGVLLAIAFNIDTIQVTNELWNNSQMRTSIAAAASSFVDKYENLDDVEASKEFFESYKTTLELPVGWNYETKKRCILKEKGVEHPWNFTFWLLKIVGFFITGIIASFGAPFWYDALQKITGLKKSIKTE
jgi:hypothetical protein